MRVIFSLTLALIISCQQKPAEVPQDMAIYDGPMLSFENIETIYSQEASAKLKIVAPLQLRLQNGDETFPKGISIDIYDELGRKKTEVTADSAHYVYENSLYLMIGHVVVTNLIERQTLETPILYWDERYREIYTDTVIKITTETEVAHGVGMRAKQDFSQYKILKFTGIFNVE